MPTQNTMTGPQWAMLLALSVLWGGSFFFNGVALRELPVLAVVAARVGLAALILLALSRLGGQRMPRQATIWRAFLVMGMLNNAIPFTLIVAGQREIASGLAAILNASTPLFTVILAHLATADERMTPMKLAGVLVGFAGVAVMIGGAALRGLGGAHLGAQLLCLAGAFSYAVAGIYGRRFRAMGVTSMQTATGQLIASALVLVPLALVVDRQFLLPAPSVAVIGAVIGLAAFSTALAYVLYFRLLAAAGATNLLLVTFLIPVSAILLGVLFLGEMLEIRQIAGMALIGLGLSAIDGRIYRRKS